MGGLSALAETRADKLPVAPLDSVVIEHEKCVLRRRCLWIPSRAKRSLKAQSPPEG